MIKARSLSCPHIGPLSVAGQCHQHHVLAPRLAADASACLVTIQFRQANIDKNNVGSKFSCRLDPLLAVISNMRGVTVRLQKPSKRLGDLLSVFNNQYPTSDA